MGKWSETQEAYYGRSDSFEENTGRVLPILFNTEMVQAILDGRKTVTRRALKHPFEVHPNGFVTKPRGNERLCPYTPPYQPDDILYVRETWAFIPCIGCNGEYARGAQPCYDFQAVEYDDGDSISDGCFVYRADCKTPEHIVWRPSIHMPKEAARIWLKIKDVRVERLQGIVSRRPQETLHNICAEGLRLKAVMENYDVLINDFKSLWDSTVKHTQLDIYGWDANPWVWVIEFERCEKPEDL